MENKNINKLLIKIIISLGVLLLIGFAALITAIIIKSNNSDKEETTNNIHYNSSFKQIDNSCTVKNIEIKENYTIISYNTNSSSCSFLTIVDHKTKKSYIVSY